MRRLIPSMLSVLEAREPAVARETPASQEPLTIEALFKDHVGDVHRIVASLLGPGAARADVEDLTQQVFLAAHRGLPDFRGEAKPTTWLYAIASRIVLTHLRGFRRQRRMREALEAEMRAPRPEPASAEERLEHQMELKRVWSCLLRINPKKRLVFILHEIEGLGGKEIAEVLDLKESTVYTRLHHARRELVARLKESP
jgi:RNA polymerase sigma-70 factor, ECF subfamily